ncbi:MAG: hypothetical protein ACREKE_09050, partial [bacterium]
CGRIALMRDGKLVALDSPAGLKRQFFPSGLLELEIVEGGSLSDGWDNVLRAQPGVLSLKPHGRRWHLEPESLEVAGALRLALPEGLNVVDLEPSLEDVFLKVVEPPTPKTASGAPHA